jgi:thiamine biosynthesis protein ThiS
MSLTVNGDEHPFREGMTVAELLAEKKYSWPLITVYVSGARIPKSQWSTTVLRDGDVVKVIHLMAGG